MIGNSLSSALRCIQCSQLETLDVRKSYSSRLRYSDIVSRRLLMFPICFKSHWSLALVFVAPNAEHWQIFRVEYRKDISLLYDEKKQLGFTIHRHKRNKKYSAVGKMSSNDTKGKSDDVDCVCCTRRNNG